jgi:hypothetical protein
MKVVFAVIRLLVAFGLLVAAYAALFFGYQPPPPVVSFWALGSGAVILLLPIGERRR